MMIRREPASPRPNLSPRYWIHDCNLANGGYTLVDPTKKSGPWKSFLTGDTNSLGHLLPPRFLWPLLAALSIGSSGLLGYMLCFLAGDHTAGYIGGCMTALASAAVWSTSGLAVCVWIAPASIPFRLFAQRHQTSKSVWQHSGPFDFKGGQEDPMKGEKVGPRRF